MKSRKWMLLFFETTDMAKTNVTLLQYTLSLHLMLIYEGLTQRGIKFFATLQH